MRRKRYARSPERLDTRAGHYERTLQTKAGQVSLQVPRLQESAVRDRDHRALPTAGVERGGGPCRGMYLTGVSVRRVWRTSPMKSGSCTAKLLGNGRRRNTGRTNLSLTQGNRVLILGKTGE